MKQIENSHPDSALYIGVDIGGTAVKYGVVDRNLTLLHKEKEPTEKSGAEALMDRVARTCQDLMKAYPVCGVGISVPGFVNAKRGVVRYSSNLPFRDTPIREYLESRLGVPVRIGNDANCAALGEFFTSRDRKVSNMVMLTIGTGVGGGVILNGRIYDGTNGDGGELGHMITHARGLCCPCGQKGCLEQYASVSALCRMAKEKAKQYPKSRLAQIGEDRLNGETVFEAARQGCRSAVSVIRTWMEEIAIGVASVRMIFAPDEVVLAGGVTEEGEAFLEPIARMCPSVPIRLAKLRNDAGIIGAAMLHREEV
ncbi:MAG: ROK family protein [Clostridia bacterium]|nr:ROK family protein [Clostridia bacterium]